MKQFLWLLIFPFSFSACKPQSRDELPDGVSTSTSFRKKITLAYEVPSSSTGAPGHQAYRIHDTWASSREEIIRLMNLAGWKLSPDSKPGDSSLTFQNNTSGTPVSPVQSIRWEKD